MNEIEKLVEGYWRWLRDKTAIRHINNWAEITTPYLDRHNDYIQIYARKHEGGYLLTDGGETLLDLSHSGFSLESPKRQAILKSVLNGFGIEESDHQLCVHTSADNFALRKHNLIQGILSVHDMFYLASPTVEALFFEDVAAWLDLSEIRFTPSVKFTGKTGFDHMFDFVIPKSRIEPERIIRAINNPNRNTAQNLIMACLDTREVRPENSVSYAFLNDNERAISSTVTDALKNYQIMPVLWSRREEIREKLAA
ncbi:MAG: hypothetical protein COA65_01265 [Rhodospirillaceae bacterium]|nr:MAG: hypothetical protein COA65_01265 [Rhodospirillaceae bacterium]